MAQVLTDPFLVAHLAAPDGEPPYAFSMGGLSPTSIRDQMIRGRMLVDRALEAGLIDTDKRPLFVDGAGVGGATAAVYAADRGVTTLLIDSKRRPFFRQAQCTTRWLDPTQYDWPLSHWKAGKYPWSDPSMPFEWESNFANVIAAKWSIKLGRDFMRLRPRLGIQYLTEVYDVPRFVRGNNPGVEVFLRRTKCTGDAEGDGKWEGPLFFGMMIKSQSYSEENTHVDAYAGFDFWDSDTLTEPNVGMRPEVPPRVLISGAGDGALQDFLRIISSGLSARDIFLRVVEENSQQWRQVITILRDAEDQAVRSYSWAGTKLHDHKIFLELERAHNEAISILESSPRQWNRTQLSLNELVVSHPDITLLHQCGHFSSCYPLNRFLVLLIRRHLANRPDLSVRFLTDSRIADVHGVYGHRCNGKVEHCHGQPHQVLVKSANCVTEWGAPQPLEGDFNVLVIRHGIKPGVRPIGISERSRQILPYHAPS